MSYRMKVNVSTPSPVLFMEVDPDDFGKIFAHMGSDEQIAVLRAMVEHMRPHSMQWDYISIELEREENAALARELRGIFAPLDADQ